MTLILLTTSFLGTFLFGAIALFLSRKKSRSVQIKAPKIKNQQEEQQQKQRLLQVSVLKEIQDRIGYSLDIEKIIDIITGSLSGLFPYSAVSSIVIKPDHLVFKTHLEESVSRFFIEKVKRDMTASLFALVGNVPKRIEESISGVIIKESNALSPGSFFHIPLIVGDTPIGLINIASTKPGLYKEEEMTILYQITNLASNTLTRLQALLTTEKGKLIATIRSLRDGVFMVDINNQLLVINDAAKKFLGITKPTPGIIDVIASLEIQYDIVSKLNDTLQHQIKLEEKEVKIGEYIFEIIINPVVDPVSNLVIGASVLLHDITLEKSIARMKEDYTSVMVHELRAPLTIIRGATDLLQTTAKMDSKQKQKFLDIINQQAKILLDDIAQLLDAAKLESGRFSLDKMPTDLAQAINERIEFFGPRAKEKKIQLSAHIEQPVPLVSCDPTRVGQVLNNLLTNSLKFTQPGGKITVNMSKQDENILISVTDNGVGIPPEKQTHLFSRFSQVLSASSTHLADIKASGSGLGLYIIKGIVEAHGGTVSLESQLYHGTTISFTIPITPVELEQKSALLPDLKTPNPFLPKNSLELTAAAQ